MATPPKHSKLYTKTGDKGETSLYNGERVRKTHPRIEVVGTLDEVNSLIGVVLSFLPTDNSSDSGVRDDLVIIQETLFTVGSHIATPPNRSSSYKLERTKFDSLLVTTLENWIDARDNETPPLRSFILPGGSPVVAHLHLVRTVTRRCERLLIALHEEDNIDPHVLQYINRLSDYFFALARWCNYHLKDQREETLWSGSSE